jgi:hypothetical protein
VSLTVGEKDWGDIRQGLLCVKLIVRFPSFPFLPIPGSLYNQFRFKRFIDWILETIYSLSRVVSVVVPLPLLLLLQPGEIPLSKPCALLCGAVDFLAKRRVLPCKTPLLSIFVVTFLCLVPARVVRGSTHSLQAIRHPHTLKHLHQQPRLKPQL